MSGFYVEIFSFTKVSDSGLSLQILKIKCAVLDTVLTLSSHFLKKCCSESIYEISESSSLLFSQPHPPASQGTKIEVKLA